ncbi:nitric oxide reductase transcriptional regulator NorR [Halomonas sp. McH1-25]|uniref:nitric oxide reductase transcriptional regulator NorR n=1 Tax=unclassified Halomonas TaxID=2609666 RepID=UPI001EF71B2D|nr:MULTISPECIES: nitric oxide reductase transcriptional regulator NorR [unclassified Halomonas]MCG7601295.1 nitric oxide reductase transcriptional regulator NorR [Halomonas sp. McH1-25]MCP1343254.1 nitric oxide reductase transcriptional regulator NorR [Halomonas sp. FL8]MCP1360755.1 nitric oxide reductase transcriptional regulator NorR [Halomonas sp. BBD45]MCP1364526.1 nitric oxide reductase transcriptional regulator NorR [Halomonas sp. BBD48]
MTSLLLAMGHLLSRMSDACPAVTQRDAWAQFLEALNRYYPADACTLMIVNREGLRPLAALGLPEDIHGRRFLLSDHSRLAAIATEPGVSRFASDSTLPAPLEGLIGQGQDRVRDSLGVALRHEDQLLGILTLDALTPAHFDQVDTQELHATAYMLANMLRVASRLESSHARLDATDDRPCSAPVAIQWHSPAMRRLDEAVKLVAPTDMNVLLHGDTGVGKERVAQQLHTLSARRDNRLVRVNCAALPEHLIESALFGHRRGAFSGAIKDHRGYFAVADGSTLMLDEIGELPLSLQPKLLRVLQEGEIQPLGSEHTQRVDVRIIAVTNRDLASEVKAGRFREDLYHRLSAFPLQVPALRDRKEDIPILTGRFLEENRVRLGLTNLRLTEDAEMALQAWHWPGNVRELEHTLSRAALRALGDRLHENDALESPQQRGALYITRTHLDLPEDSVDAPFAEEAILPASKNQTVWMALREATDNFQRRYIYRALASHDDNWAATARALATDSGNLHRLGKRLGLK